MDLIEKYLGEGRKEENIIKKREFEKMGLKFHPKWDDFIRKNQKIIEKEVEKLKNPSFVIADKKRRDKKFKDEMRDLKNKLTDLWSSVKNMNESRKDVAKDMYGNILKYGDIVDHNRFGIGKVVDVDNSSYSISIITVVLQKGKFKGERIARHAAEFERISK